ncbi:M35 family metallo-endopeptidase [Paucibacter sp. APW11]|uniref:M35 family metallo-endopeptidase n=1 Tax=Roseateles aquae TaxID=3077235 RepID=A0ABU3P7R5_9BURK|nr:M35 family metallo-endopeptidase [Paucibacter sp. APW11]MDT8998614.1 M35 family metallo-endopeptidase [Paucibacter sp. APW11]
MNLFSSKWRQATVVCAAALGAQAAAAAGLDVRVSLAKPVLIGDVDVVVNVTVTNTSRAVQQVAKSQLPGQVQEGALFRISRDGLPVDYTGPLVKRGPRTAADFLSLAPGVSLSYEVELTAYYDLSQNGRYALEYVGLNKHDGAEGLVAATAPTYFWLEGRTAKFTPDLQASQGLNALAGSISYTGNCSSSQKTALQNAVTAATNYSQGATSYLSGAGSGTQRYKTWFGTYSASGWNTAKSHYTSTLDAFKNKPLTLDCSCKQSYYAYVYPTQPYKIYVCNAFWSAPATGTDSKAGTLVHEMTHFNVVASTDDWAYGQSAAKSLAISNPAKALDNADSHEYFAENSPPLP